MIKNLVSIIMPCHNGEKFISQAIESVISQTYKNWELLIVDDNSLDNSIKVINYYINLDNRIKLLKNENKTGLPATPRNVGIKKATGRFIAFLDCDDIWLSSKLEKQLPLFNDVECAVVFSFYEKINDEGTVCSKVLKSPKLVSFNDLLKGDCIGNLTGIYDTNKVGKIFQKEIHAEDYLMWLEILRNGFVAKNTNTLEAQYRVLNYSTSANKFKSAKWNWNIYKNELKLPLHMAMKYFIVYFVKGLIKYLK